MGGDATVTHINQSKMLAPAIVKPVNPYRKPVLPGPYQLTMEEAILRNEYDMQQQVDEKHQQFESFKNDLEFEQSEKERMAHFRKMNKI